MADSPRVTAEIIEQVSKELADYKRDNFGQFGPDFSDVTAALRKSNDFAFRCMLFISFGMMNIDKLAAKLESMDAKNPDAIREAFSGSTIERLSVEIFYQGYLVGKRSSEIAALEKLHAKEEQR